MNLDETFDRIPALAATPRTITELSGGLTNHNVKVTTPDGVFVARCTRSDTSLLRIDRAAEFHNTRVADESGVGAPFVDFRPDLGVLVIGFLEGRTCTDADLREPGMIQRLADTMFALHSGPRFVGEFDMFSRQAGYRATCQERGFAIPDGYDEHAADFARIARAVAIHPITPVPCNNDLLSANLVDDGEKLWLIDYEYSGMGDPFFELGNSWAECGLDDDHLGELVTAYVGHEDPSLLARARLRAITSRYGWALWGCIQAATLDDEFDFAAWGAERFERARSDFADPAASANDGTAASAHDDSSARGNP